MIGTLSYEKGNFAFFEGSSSEYRKVLSPADTIAGYKIAEITADHVKLEGTNGQAIELPVGKEMKKADEEPWRLDDRSAAAVDIPASATANSSSNAPPATEKTGSASSGAENEILKRLLEKREQELNK